MYLPRGMSAFAEAQARMRRGMRCAGLPGENFLRLERVSLLHVCRLADEWGVRMATKAEEYLAKARDCEERAKQTPDPFIRQQLNEIAHKWRQMAEHETKHPR